MNHQKGFTVFELVVVLLAIGFLAFILLPIFSRHGHRDVSKRVKCAANLRSIGQSLNIYANDYNDYFPVVGMQNNHKASNFGLGGYGDEDGDLTQRQKARIYNLDNYRNGQTYSQTSHLENTRVGASLYLLVKYQDQPPFLFQCPSDKKYREMDLQEAIEINPNIERWQDLNDFSGRRALSYSFWDMFNHSANVNDWGSRVVAADINPACDSLNFEFKNTEVGSENIMQPGLGPYIQEFIPENIIWDDSTDQTKIGHGNSSNHQTEMQNVLYGDSHVEKHETPLAGAQSDNIYTHWTDIDPLPENPDETTKQQWLLQGQWDTGRLGTPGKNNPAGSRDLYDIFLGN